MPEAPASDPKLDYSFGQIAIRENLTTLERVRECMEIQGRLRSIGIDQKAEFYPALTTRSVECQHQQPGARRGVRHASGCARNQPV